MPDLRENVLLNHMEASRLTAAPGSRLWSHIKLAVRWLVVATSGSPLRYVYAAIYRAHVAYALRVLKRLPGVQSIYLTGGAAIDDIKPGISDIDLTVIGEFSSEEQSRVSETLRRLSRLSPLYDTVLSRCVQTLSDLRSLYETDYFFQYRFDQGRSRWKLLYGEAVFDHLPHVPEERRAGGYYTEMRTWWCYFLKSAFGSTVLAHDDIFRKSVAYKAYSGVLTIRLALETGEVEVSRKKAIERALSRSEGVERAFLGRLTRSANRRHLSFEGDIQEETFRQLIALMEDTHARIAATPGFHAVEAFGMHIDGSADEMLRTEAADAHIAEVIAHVKREWKGYRAAFLVPSLSFFYPDDLVLLLEVDGCELPSVRQIRNLRRFHAKRASGLPQRVALFLLLPNGAYQLEVVSDIELWHHTLSPAANPEVFAFLHRPEFVLDGNARAGAPAPIWSRFANDLVNEEITIRRAAFGKTGAAAAGALSSLEILRNLWRHMQLEIIERSVKFGFVYLPLTLPAMQRAFEMSETSAGPLLDQLREAYESELQGKTTDVQALLPQLMALFESAEMTPS